MDLPETLVGYSTLESEQYSLPNYPSIAVTDRGSATVEQQKSCTELTEETCKY